MTRRVFPAMGTIVSLDLDEDADGSLEGAVRAEFARWERRFSLYDPASELSRIARGDLRMSRSSEQLRDTYAAALEWSAATLGAFTPHRPDGVFDLSGIVKALAIEGAGRILDAAGCASWVVDCGGDVLERRSAGAASTAVGIADPADSGRLLTAVQMFGTRRAIATSGIGERGEHVWGRSAEFAQVTVLADGILEADVLATAVLAGGTDVLDHITAARDIDVLAVHRDGRIVATPGIRLAAGAPHS